MKLLSRTALLIVLNAAVLLGGGLVSYVILSHKVDANVPPPKPGKTIQPTALGVAFIKDDAILSQPIFRRSRQAIGFGGADTANSAESKAEVQPPPIPPAPVLAGVLRGTAGQSWVLLEGGGGANRRLLSKGGDFEGWRVLRIGAKEVTLHHRESKVDIQIRLPNSSVDSPAIPK
jgi:hypothetical protein